MLACTAAPVHATAPVYTTASACNASLVYTTMPAYRKVLRIENDVLHSSLLLHFHLLLLLLTP
eukprot:4977752-Pyramimonas_sp.AAC.1